jgi:hypothetical protein
MTISLSQVLLLAITLLPSSQGLVSRCSNVERYGTNNGEFARKFLQCPDKMKPFDSTEMTGEHDSLGAIAKGESDATYKSSLFLRRSEVSESIHETISPRKVLRGGRPEVVTPLQSSTRVRSILFAINLKKISISLCSFALAIIISTMFMYFVFAVYVFNGLEAWHGHELSPDTIASLSLIFSVLGSSATCGAFLGRIAPSHPTQHAAVVSAAFILLQLWQLALFRGVPVWLTVLTITSYPPCCVYAAKCFAERNTAGESAAAAYAASAAPAADTATSADADAAHAVPAEPSPIPAATAPPNAPAALAGVPAAAAATPPAEFGRAAAEPRRPGGGNPVLGWLRRRVAALRGRRSDAR